MVYGYGGHCGFTCQSQCPPQQAYIQPPPFCVTIPGPILSCYDGQLAVDCNTPCGYGCGGYGGWGGYGGCGGYGGWGGYGCGRGFGGWGGYSGCGGGWGRGWGW